MTADLRERVRASIVGCPSLAMPVNADALTDAVLEAMPQPDRLIISSEPSRLRAIDIPIVATADDWNMLSAVLASLAVARKGSRVAAVATHIHRQIDRIVIANLQPDAPEGAPPAPTKAP
jgi:hypothetical protein